MATQGHLPFGSPPAAPPPAAAVTKKEDRSVKEAKGQLTHGRQKEIDRHEGGLMNFVHNWENKSIIAPATIAKMIYSQRDLITENMKPIHDALKKEHHLKTVKGQFKGYFETAVSEPVLCWEKNGQAIETLINQTVGDMNPKDLKKTINDSTVGKLNTYLDMLRTFVAEEMDEKIRCAYCHSFHLPAQRLVMWTALK